MGAFAFIRWRHRTMVPADLQARIAHFAELVKTEPTAANYRLLADSCVQDRNFTRARDAFENAANVYRGKGMTSEGYAEDRLSERYEVQAIPFFQEPTRGNQPPVADTHAKFEPVYGCYSGAFIDHEDSIHGTYRDEYQTWRRDASAFNHLTGIHHAIFFMYLGYGRMFPTKFLTHVNDNGGAAQIAFEPKSLNDVRDDEYLHGFARAAKATRTPIFLRFASEMNGDWVPYNGNPAQYIEKFRLVARIMHAEAPNVAMVWCPFEIPVRTIADYFPGDDAVDWVGLNIYSVPYWDNDPHRTADWRNPADSLRYVYDRYSAKHPIMICEYAASHRSSLDNVDRPDLARTKMGELYAALPRMYPRVKAVCWLSMNAIKHAIPGRQSNDYSLLGDNDVRERYRELVDDPYYLGAVSRGKPAEARAITMPLSNGQVLAGKVPLSAWVKLYEDHPRVVWKVNGQIALDSSLPGPYRWVLDTTKMAAGPAAIELDVFDEQGQSVVTETRNVFIRKKPA